jgi:DNA-binding winged helix-turn-helix (wHTH) protein
MRKKSFYYDFKGLRFSPFRSQIEILESGKKINLSQIHSLFLLALAENPGKIVTYDDLRRLVWVHEREVNERFIHNVQSTKNGLVKSLKTTGVTVDFIKPIPGKGYLLDADVTEEIEPSESEIFENISPFSANNLLVLNQETPESEGFRSDKKNERRAARLLGEHAGFVLTAGLLYGILYWIALLLEIAYKFDRFGVKALWFGLPLTAWIAGTSISSLLWTEDLIRRHKPLKALIGGLMFFLVGCVATCIAVSYFLPPEPVTLARFQTQPAFAAYLKNCLIYFLPLGVVFILLPFYAVCLHRFISSLPRSAESVFSIRISFILCLRPAHLFGLWAATLMYSIYATFYLLDNLQTGEFHNLFVTLAFVRFFVYFGLGLMCLIWFHSVSHFAAQFLTAASSATKKRSHQIDKGAVLIPALLIAGAGMVVAAASSSNATRIPRLETVELIATPDERRQLFVRLKGENFEPSMVSVSVSGGDCAEVSPCVVPNGALKKHSLVTENVLENVPLTLPAGEFRLRVQNDDSSFSGFVLLNVP